jgi:hypothetical protein
MKESKLRKLIREEIRNIHETQSLSLHDLASLFRRSDVSHASVVERGLILVTFENGKMVSFKPKNIVQ